LFLLLLFLVPLAAVVIVIACIPSKSTYNGYTNSNPYNSEMIAKAVLDGHRRYELYNHHGPSMSDHYKSIR